MNAVAKELQDVTVELQSREHRRKLFVKHKPEYSFWWAGDRLVAAFGFEVKKL